MHVLSGLVFLGYIYYNFATLKNLFKELECNKEKGCRNHLHSEKNNLIMKLTYLFTSLFYALIIIAKSNIFIRVIYRNVEF